MAGIGFSSAANYKTKAGNGLGPVTQIVEMDMDSGNVTQAALDDMVQAMGAAGHTIAGIAGDVGDASVHIAIQGGATIATDATDAFGVTGTNITAVCVFTD